MPNAAKAALPVVLVTGASGLLGTSLVPTLAKRARVVGLYNRNPPPAGASESYRCDLTDPEAVRTCIAAVQPDAVVHAAAANPGSSAKAIHLANVVATTNLVRALAPATGCHLVHVSTDVIFDGTAAPYDETAVAKPLNDYGRAKAAAEAFVLSERPESVAVRTSLIYGLAVPDRGTQAFLDRLAAGEPVRLFMDVLRQPVWVEALSQALAALALDLPHVSGPLNVAGAQPLTRAEFGRRLLTWWKVPLDDRVVDVRAAGLADVPLDLRLRLDRATALGLPTPGFDEVAAAHAPGVRSLTPR